MKIASFVLLQVSLFLPRGCLPNGRPERQPASTQPANGTAAHKESDGFVAARDDLGTKGAEDGTSGKRIKLQLQLLSVVVDRNGAIVAKVSLANLSKSAVRVDPQDLSFDLPCSLRIWPVGKEGVYRFVQYLVSFTYPFPQSVVSLGPGQTLTLERTWDPNDRLEPHRLRQTNHLRQDARQGKEIKRLPPGQYMVEARAQVADYRIMKWGTSSVNVRGRTSDVESCNKLWIIVP